MRSPGWSNSRRVALALALGLVLTACSGGGEMGTAASVSGEVEALPDPILAGSVSLEEALATRRSLRDFADSPLTASEMSQLLWAAQGITEAGGGRTAPSAGGLYPLEVYVATAEGVFHYRPAEHGLRMVADRDVREALAEVALGQEPVREAPVVFVVTAVFDRTAAKYGDRAVRYVHLEAGHAAQGVLLQAVALGLGGVPIGAFDDAGVQEVLGLPVEHEPLYLIPVGRPGE